MWFHHDGVNTTVFTLAVANVVQQMGDVVWVPPVSALVAWHGDVTADLAYSFVRGHIPALFNWNGHDSLVVIAKGPTSICQNFHKEYRGVSVENENAILSKHLACPTIPHDMSI